jgi:hypothetical protein
MAKPQITKRQANYNIHLAAMEARKKALLAAPNGQALLKGLQRPVKIGKYEIGVLQLGHSLLVADVMGAFDAAGKEMTRLETFACLAAPEDVFAAMQDAPAGEAWKAVGKLAFAISLNISPDDMGRFNRWMDREFDALGADEEDVEAQVEEHAGNVEKAAQAWMAGLPQAGNVATGCQPS